MYGDLQFTQPSNGFKFKGSTKVYKFDAHELTYEDSDFIVGFAGTASDIITVTTFFLAPEMFLKRPPRVKDLSGLVLTAKGDLFLFDDYTKWLAIKEPFAAIGSGAQVALGAMHAGASPKEAVKVAMKHDAFTGMGIKGEKFS